MNPPTQIYYWPRSFVLRSTDFVQTKPYQRISTTVIVALDGTFDIAIEDQGLLQCHGAVLGPTARRLSLNIGRAGALIIEAAPNTPEHFALMRYLKHRPSAVLVAAEMSALRDAIAPYAKIETLSAEQARALHAAAIRSLVVVPDEIPRDARVEQALAYLETELLDSVCIADLARQIQVSESRLRSLVRRQLSCSLSQYVRWLAAWRTVVHWRPGLTLTDIAHAAGFHDLAHANHTINEMFGMSPSKVLLANQVQLISCV